LLVGAKGLASGGIRLTDAAIAGHCSEMAQPN
jgi:hypothetical protein